MMTTAKCGRCQQLCLLTYNGSGERVLIQPDTMGQGRYELSALESDWLSPKGKLSAGTAVSMKHSVGDPPKTGHSPHDDHCKKLKRNEYK